MNRAANSSPSRRVISNMPPGPRVTVIGNKRRPPSFSASNHAGRGCVAPALATITSAGANGPLTMQFLGIRLFNAAAVSLKLALSGYYQKAFVHVRDILETYFLVDYLRNNTTAI